MTRTRTEDQGCGSENSRFKGDYCAEEFDLETLQRLAPLVLPFITAVALLLGFTYYAGFFWEMDYHLYSAFSLTEHTVFALQALPLGLGIMTGVSMVYIAQFLRPFESGSPSFRAVSLGFVAILLASFTYLAGATSTASAFLFAGTCFLAYPVISRRGVLMSALFIVLPIISFAFSMGLDNAAGAIKRPRFHEITFQGSSPIMGRFLRAGSISFLYLDGKGRPVFGKWDGFVSVVRLKE